MIKKIDLSVIVPVLNEEDNILPFINRLNTALKSFKNYEVIFAIDPSSDRTSEIIKSLCEKRKNIKAIFFSRRFGQPTAVMAGILNCKGETCVIIDIDLQDPPELIPMLYNKLKMGSDVVYAKRKKRKGETLIKLIISYLGYKLINKIAQVNIPRDTGDFRIITRRVIEELRRLPENHGFLRGLVAIIGFKQDEVEYERDERFSGVGKYNRFFGSMKIGLNGVIGFSSFLLTLNLLVGIVISFLSFLTALWVVIHKVFYNTEYSIGFPTIIILITFIGGIQLVGIGILGEYIGRIYDEVKGRPRYIIDYTLNMDKLVDNGYRLK